LNELSSWLEQSLGIPVEIQGKLLSSLIALVIVLAVQQLLSLIVVRRIEDLRTRYLWKKTIGYAFFFIGLLVIGPIWIEGIQSISTYLGLLSAGLAIALRDVITDMLGWIYLIWRRPLSMGDRVQVGDQVGDVIDQGVFQFTLMEVGGWVGAEQSTGRLLYIPNSTIFRSVVANYSKGSPFIWNEIPVLLAFGSNWEKAKQILADVVNEQHLQTLDEAAEEHVRKISDRYLIQSGKLTPMVYTSVKENGIQLSLRYLCEPRRRRDSTHAIWERVLHEFAQHPDVQFVNQPVIVTSLPENA
jgi:small-conductance mechanosensitive channel